MSVRWAIIPVWVIFAAAQRPSNRESNDPLRFGHPHELCQAPLVEKNAGADPVTPSSNVLSLPQAGPSHANMRDGPSQQILSAHTGTDTKGRPAASWGFGHKKGSKKIKYTSGWSLRRNSNGQGGLGEKPKTSNRIVRGLLRFKEKGESAEFQPPILLK